MSFLPPRTPFPISLFLHSFSFPRGSPHCQEGLDPVTCGSPHPRPVRVLWLHACCRHSSHTSVQILCGQAYPTPVCPPSRRGLAGRRGCPGMSRLPKASAGTGSEIQEVAMATAGPSCHLLQSALGPGHPLGFLEICSLGCGAGEGGS